MYSTIMSAPRSIRRVEHTLAQRTLQGGGPDGAGFFDHRHGAPRTAGRATTRSTHCCGPSARWWRSTRSRGRELRNGGSSTPTVAGQVDLVVLPAHDRPERAPGAVALLDRSGRLA